MTPQQFTDLKWLLAQRQWKVVDEVLDVHRGKLQATLEQSGPESPETRSALLELYYLSKIRRIVPGLVKEFESDLKEKITK